MKRAALGCVLLLLLLFAGGGYLYWRALNPPQVGETFTELSPEEQQLRRDDARKLEDEVADVVRSVRRGERKQFRITASEQQLNTLLQDRIRTEKFVIRDLRAGLDDGALALQGTVPYKGLETTATLKGDIQAHNGKIEFKTKSLLLGGLVEAPKDWKQKIEKQVTQQLNKLLDNVEVTSAVVANKQLVIEGQPN